MNRSVQEEILFVLYMIAAILCFGFGFKLGGSILTIKAVCDLICSIYHAVKRKVKEG